MMVGFNGVVGGGIYRPSSVVVWFSCTLMSDDAGGGGGGGGGVEGGGRERGETEACYSAHVTTLEGVL